MSTPPSFDRIARAYRWMEYAALGRALERTREHHLAALAGVRRALLLGDGDGRFTARLLAANPNLQAQAVDASAAMLALLTRRCRFADARLQTMRQDARGFRPAGTFDLVVTHFFLDCLTGQEVEALIANLQPALAPGALWLVSEFRIPPGLLRWPAQLYVRGLYLAFRLLADLRVSHLPGYAQALERSGFVLLAEHRRLFGLLTTQLWRYGPYAEPDNPAA